MSELRFYLGACFIALVCLAFLPFSCVKQSFESRVSKGSSIIDQHYSPVFFLTPISESFGLSIQQTSNVKNKQDSIHTFVYDPGFAYVLVQKKMRDVYNYYVYLELNGKRYPMNDGFIPSPGLVLNCVKYKLNSLESLVAFYYWGDYVNTSRPSPDLMIALLNHQTKKWTLAFAGHHFEYKKEDIGIYKDQVYFLNDLGREKINVFKLTDGRFKPDLTRKIMLRDSAETGIRFIDWGRTKWP
jgi:hypothetical protein